MSLSTSTARAGPARERLDRERPRAAEEVENLAPRDPVAQDREDRLARALRRWGARPARRRAARRAAARRARRRRPASGRETLRALVAEAPRGDVEQQAQLRRVERAVRARGALATSRRASSSSSSRRAARPPGTAAARCWRVPRISPSPRSARSTSASLKPSRSAAIASIRRRARSDSRVGEEDAVRLVLAAADPPAELVELREPKALGALDEHHGGVRDVDADLDHRRRHEHVASAPPRTRSIAAAFSRDDIWPWSSPTSKSANSPVRKPLGLLVRRLRLELLGALDQRADDERLAALAQPLADELVGARPLLLPHRPGLHGLPAGRQLAKRGRVEVAVGGERERPRDRRGRHVQHVRGARRAAELGPLRRERRALADPEAVLLVDDGDRQPREARRRARGARASRRSARARRSRAGQGPRGAARRALRR